MRIILGVCGSIAAYKTFDLARGLIKAGHEIKVVLTKGSLNFVKPEVFKYLGVSEVYLPTDDFNYPKSPLDSGSVLHIELAKWAQHLLIYPASANTLANLAFGKSNDLLTSIFLAKRDDLITSIFPAMNTLMYTHPITQENIDLLKRIYISKNIFIHPPASGELACGDVGEGKAPAIEKVISCIEGINPNINQDSPLALITTGATIAPIDPVRYVTNASSGKTGFELSIEALKRGYRVHIIAGLNATPLLDTLKDLPGFELSRVITTRDMKDAVSKYFDKCSLYISAAAISDLEFNMAQGKLKKSDMADSLPFSKAPDILAYALEQRKEQKVIGFAAETDLSHNVLKEKWERKPVDLLVGTEVHSGLCHDKNQSGFNTDKANYKFFCHNSISFEGSLHKNKLPSKIFEELKNV